MALQIIGRFADAESHGVFCAQYGVPWVSKSQPVVLADTQSSFVQNRPQGLEQGSRRVGFGQEVLDAGPG